MNITPAMGVIEVRRINKGTISLNDLNSIIVFPNPTEGDVQVQFKIKEDGYVDMSISDEVGRRIQTLLKENMPAGKYKYLAKLDSLADGIYVASVTSTNQVLSGKVIKK
jgi:hypothetical protein